MDLYNSKALKHYKIQLKKQCFKLSLSQHGIPPSLPIFHVSIMKKKTHLKTSCSVLNYPTHSN